LIEFIFLILFSKRAYSMNHPVSLSSSLRWLMYLSAALYLLVGLTMFLAPAWAASNFAWSVSPFVAMTIGAWCIGNAVIAFESARMWRWAVTYPALIYLWAFALAETGVLIFFRDRVTLNSPIAWAYALALVVAVLNSLLGIFEVVIRRPAAPPLGAPIRTWVRAAVLFFVMVVTTLALGGLQARQGGLSTEGAVFPEPLTLFTVRAFAVFFGSLVIEGIILLRSQGVIPLYFTLRTSIWLIIPILIAAFVHLNLFDFAARPLGLGYFAAYIGTLIFSFAVLWAYRDSSPTQVQE
jgi:hypothetical protein